MTHKELFYALAPLVMPCLEKEFHRRDLCIAATRLAIHVGQYFGVEVRAQACRVMLANRQFAKHLEEAFAKGIPLAQVDVKAYAAIDGSHSVGIGWPNPNHKWPLHLVAAGGGLIGDFAISQAERPELGIVTGSAIVAPIAKSFTCIEATSGTQVWYHMIADDGYKKAPDWKHSRTSRLAGPIIRQIRDAGEQEKELLGILPDLRYTDLRL